MKLRQPDQRLWKSEYLIFCNLSSQQASVTQRCEEAGFGHIFPVQLAWLNSLLIFTLREKSIQLWFKKKKKRKGSLELVYH